MRRTKLYQLLAVAGGLGVAVASTPTLAKPAEDVVVPLNWTAGTAVVDGNIGEWDLSDGNIMCTAGSISEDGTSCVGNGKDHLSTLYMRYDCSTETMYILVLKEDGYTAEGERWVKIYDSDSGQSEYPITIEDVVVDGESQGYEASFSLAAGSYNDVQIHMNVSGNTSSTGKNGYTRSITVEACGITCADIPHRVHNPSYGGPQHEPQMGSIDKFEWSNGGYTHVSGTESVEIADTSTSTRVEWSVKPELIRVIDVDAVIINGAVYEHYNTSDDRARRKGDFYVPTGVSTIEFCEDGHFSAKDAEVCLWMADKDKDDNYINIEQVGCVGAEKGKFYAIEAGGEFSSVLEAE